MPDPGKPGASIPMPSVELKLPRHVTLRRKLRADGSHAVYFYFQIKRAADPAWSKSRRLPLAEAERTSDASAAELAAVVRDASRLQERYEREMAGLAAQRATDTLPWLCERFQERDAYAQGSRHARDLYDTLMRKVIAFSAASGHPSVTELDTATIEEYLALHRDRPAMRGQLKRFLSRLFRIALSYEIVSRNPVDPIELKSPKREADPTKGPWTRDDVESRIRLCMSVGRPSLALAILIGYETGQRPENIDLFRVGEHYDADDGVFAFEQTKTGAYVAVPATVRLRRWIKRFGGDDFLLISESTGRPYQPGEVQAALRYYQIKHGLPILKRRYLRHTCVCELADAECSVPEIASITGHELATVHTILGHYWRPSSAQAGHAIEKRESSRREQKSKLSVQTRSKPTVVYLDGERDSRMKLQAKPTGGSAAK